jgi:hypothetical protein
MSLTVWTFISIVIAAALIIWAVVIGARKARDKAEARKVIRMSLHKRKSGQGGNPRNGSKTCSFCKKKSKRLAFYANEGGQVVGVCEACRPQAERRALMRL